MRGQAHVDRKHPELAKHLQDSLLGRDGEREYGQIHARDASELDEIVDVAEFGIALQHIGSPIVAAIVEQPEQAHFRRVCASQIAQQLGRVVSASDDHGSPLEPALARKSGDQTGQEQTLDDDA